MFVSFISRVLSAWFAFLLPSFATFKALSRLPHSEPEVQRWGMYWAVVGWFVAFEYLAEWVISWFPFYWELKTLFFLYLALPQTQGSTFIYKNYVQPFLTKNEAALDEGINALQSNALAFIQQKVTDILGLITRSLNKQGAAQGQGQQNGQPAIPLQTVANLWQSYGPSVLGALGTPAAATGANAHPSQSPVNGGLTPRTSAPTTPFSTQNAKPPVFPSPQHFATSG
ncbi:hypothetical protein FA15DRAFT_684022 [Coprinopsis marcescibilis]|uniref:Protein YOP1 n=1 Tax=Coprinopsis marcescibilis TaxID=230819 RepID=A0A5C3LF73_COPMA|nr:hypothetical protein FA15DRAFT_684022 [Coprinopsis marcescibilis]